MKEIRISDHAQQKIKILANHEINLNIDFILETIRPLDLIEKGENDKKIAQKCLNEKLVLKVVYREFAVFILIITLYPGRRSRHEKN